MKAIPAGFESRCGLCDDDIEPGDPIVEAEGEWCHASCARDAGYAVEEDDDG